MATLIGEAASHVTTRARRRVLVAGYYASLAASISLVALGRGSGAARYATAGLLLLIATLVAHMVLLHLTHHSRTNPSELLDERGRAVRDRAYRRAYRLLTWIVAAALLYAWLAARYGWWIPARPPQWAATLAIACYLMTSLAPAAIAWTEPDLPLDDPEELAAERETLRGVGLPPLRLRIIGTLAALGVALSVAELAGAGLVPERYDDAVTGVATGLVFGALLVWGQGRNVRRRGAP